MAERTERVAVVTGATAGIGLAAARVIAAQGYRLIALGRSPAHAEAARREIEAAAPGARVDIVLADLAVMAGAAQAAREIAALTDRIDVLVNNAGGVAQRRHVTADGYEHTLAANHLGPFQLTERLVPLIRAAAPGARIVNTSSRAQNMVKRFPWEDPQAEKRFAMARVYGASKLANMLFTHALAKRLAGEGIAVNAMHPGLIGSHFGDRGGGLMARFWTLFRPLMKTPEQGADTIVWLATAPEAAACNGGYFIKRRPARPNPAGVDDAEAERLWALSERLVAATGA
jgi:NAD(P)-dependent dehydrogenase (short-subunit alcohol dehydrogenase family)